MTKKNENIIPCLQRDYTDLFHLWERSVAATHDFLAPEDFEFLKIEVPKYFPEMEHIYICIDGETVCGFVAVNQRKIEMLFADPEFIGKGVGSALFDYAVRELGAVSVDVNEQNTAGLQFYIRKGCKVVSRTQLDHSGKPYPILHLSIG